MTKMKVTIVYDNEAYLEGLEADWGFSCLIQAESLPTILFDTGAKGSILLRNMQKLDIDPLTIDEVFISHPHWDHTGGLADLTEVNKRAKIYLPRSMASGHIYADATNISEALQLHECVYSTGELQDIEQSLVIETEGGLAVIVGCSHSSVGAILEAASNWGKPYALIGGLHAFRQFDLLEGLGLVCACHCTQYKRDIEKSFKGKYNSGGVGRTLQL